MDWLQRLFQKEDEQVEVRAGEVVLEHTPDDNGGGSSSDAHVDQAYLHQLAVSSPELEEPEIGSGVRLVVKVDLGVANELADARAEIATLRAEAESKLNQLEEEWSEKMGEYMQRNAQLRVDAKQAVRRATAAEKDLALATERIKTLEQGLEDAALGSDERLDRQLESGTPIASLGAGHGGFDLTSPALSQLGLTTPAAARDAAAPGSGGLGTGGTGGIMEIDADELLADGRDTAAAEVAAALAAEQAEVKANYTPAAAKPVSADGRGPSPSKLVYEADPDDMQQKAMEAAAKKAPPKGGCCVVS